MSFLNSKFLKHKRVLVTGASRGLGQSFCETFARYGAQVAFNYSRDEEGAQITQEKITAQGSQALAYRASVLDEKALEEMVKDIHQQWGGLDILVNNAAISQPLPIALMESQDWDLLMDLNVKGYFLTTKAVLKGMMRQKKGCILNLSSLAGVRMIEAPIHYSASKAAIKGFSEALCKEIGRYNIQVNCLAPGLLLEGLGQNLPDHRVKDYLEHVSLERLGSLEEVAECAAFLISDFNSYMNGATVVMDGGL